MKVIAANIGKPTVIQWKGKEEITGIFKYPVTKAIELGTEVVANDTVANRAVHGGEYKACYLFSADEYTYWKNLYPDLSWDWGMFGENLSVQDLDEASIRIGNVYKVGSALVQISQPREPCYKLGVRFGSQGIIQQFIDRGYPGTYVRILQKGNVKAGDHLELIEEADNPLTIQQFYQLLFSREKDKQHLKLAIENTALPEAKREKLKRWL
ncbi:MOSC domain-containing protein [Muriicola sp. Z0-33]|uniref:MOSC domain-containing protein n=1 Tax=Muriicola sp. Z0-33 TaxID=2816957 RepID=UPI002237E843|nr:MOSC domain-containing protein [Muriicola sp. Z0-33]MCW5517395.1 MOSC domain-containing protein [Muriicola sp. Z0-33]